MKRATGLEPALRPWKGLVQPLHHARATKLGPILREAPALTRVLRAQWCILTAFRGPNCARGLAGGARRGRSPPDLTRRLCPTGPRKGGEPPREQCRPRRPDRAAARAKTSWRVESRGQARDRCATADSLQQTAELLRAEADAAHDAVQRAGLEVAIVDGDRHRPALAGVPHDVVAAAHTRQLSAVLLERPDELLRLDRRELVAHALAVTRPVSARRTSQPSSRIVSR